MSIRPHPFAYACALNLLLWAGLVGLLPSAHAAKAVVIGTTLPDGAVLCAPYEGVCVGAVGKRVWYGHDTRWNSGIWVDGDTCGNYSFGGDPAGGVYKDCFLAPEDPEPEEYVCTSAICPADAIVLSWGVVGAWALAWGIGRLLVFAASPDE